MDQKPLTLEDNLKYDFLIAHALTDNPKYMTFF